MLLEQGHELLQEGHLPVMRRQALDVLNDGRSAGNQRGERGPTTGTTREWQCSPEGWGRGRIAFPALCYGSPAQVPWPGTLRIR